MTTTSFVGRALFSILFIGAGLSKLTEWDAKTGGPISQVMIPKIEALISWSGQRARLPKDYASRYPSIVLAAGTMEVLGALLLVADIRFGACLLMTFLTVTSVVIHDFWNLPAGTAQTQEMINFLKNLSLIGACLIYLGGPKASKNGGSKKTN